MKHIRSSSNRNLFLLENNGNPNLNLTPLLTDFNETVENSSLCVDRVNDILYILKGGVWNEVGQTLNGILIVDNTSTSILMPDFSAENSFGAIINSPGSSVTSGVVNTVVIGGRDIVATQNNSTYVNQISFFNSYSTSGGYSDGILKAILTSDRTWELPDKSGRVALIDDLNEILDLLGTNSYVSIPTFYDKDIPTIACGVDNTLVTNYTITQTPTANSYVSVFLNGQELEVGNGVKTKPFYFSNDGGVTAKKFTSDNPVETGDQLFCNPSILGFNILEGWRISLHYNILSGFSGSSGIINLYDLNDVNISTPVNGQVLQYNGSSGLWENKTVGVIGSTSGVTREEFDSATSGIWYAIENFTGNDYTTAGLVYQTTFDSATTGLWGTIQNLTGNDYTTAGLVHQTTFDSATSGLWDYMFSNTPKASGTSGYIQFSDGNTFASDAEFVWDNAMKMLKIGNPLAAEAKLDIKADDNTINNSGLRIINSDEDVVFEVTNAGAIKIYETNVNPTLEINTGIITLNSAEELKLYSESGTSYLNVDKMIKLRDVSTENLTTGDILVYNGSNFMFENSSTNDFDLVLFERAININSNQELLFGLPSRYKITSIVIEEIYSSTAGSISIGTTSGGVNIINAVVVGASALVEIDVRNILKGFFSITTDTPLFVSSSGWGSGLINIYFKFELIV